MVDPALLAVGRRPCSLQVFVRTLVVGLGNLRISAIQLQNQVLLLGRDGVLEELHVGLGKVLNVTVEANLLSDELQLEVVTVVAIMHHAHYRGPLGIHVQCSRANSAGHAAIAAQ